MRQPLDDLARPTLFGLTLQNVKARILTADNTQFGEAGRCYVAHISKALELGTCLEQISEGHVRMSFQRQAAFGLRPERLVKFQPNYVERGPYRPQRSWTKDGRERPL